MSQKQIMRLKILSLSSNDLKQEIERELEENPALEIKKTTYFSDSSRRTSGWVDEEASDRFQAALEATVDDRESLHDALLFQLDTTNLTESEKKLGEKLIWNLDDKGHHILAPETLLDKKDKFQNMAMLRKMIALIQSFEPEGTCTKDTQESLYVQAKQKTHPDKLALFLLKDHFNFLNPPEYEKIARKVTDYLKAQKKMFGAKEESLTEKEVTPEAAETALEFIRSLNPFPTRNFSGSKTVYISPDLFVENITEKIDTKDITEEFSKGIIKSGDSVWKVRLANESIPKLSISPIYKKMMENGGKDKSVKESIKKAQDFIQAINSRQETLLHSACFIVKKQIEFFEKGPGNLAPLKQQDVADVIGVHVATVSRMANSKYIQCDYGLYAIKYFFINGVKTIPAEDGSCKNISRDKAIQEIKKIMEEYSGEKKITDKKISDILLERGIKIARRTVAKYRSLI